MSLLDTPRRLLHEWSTRRKNHRTIAALESQLETRDPILLVHQMGRAGSMTTVNTLRQGGLALPVFHTHTLYPETVRERLARVEQLPESRHPLNLRVSRRITAELESRGNRYRPWKLVTIFRDPVARNISEFFLSIEDYIPDFARLDHQGRLDHAQLLETFLEKFPHEQRLGWVERELETVFDLDVYGQAFARQGGFQVIRAEGVDLLILKIEHLNQSFQAAFRDFLGIEVPELAHTHITEQDPTRAMYRDFVRGAVLPSSYLDRMYDTDFAGHFYTPEEIAAFRRKWSTPE